MFGFDQVVDDHAQATAARTGARKMERGTRVLRIVGEEGEA